MNGVTHSAGRPYSRNNQMLEPRSEGQSADSIHRVTIVPPDQDARISSNQAEAEAEAGPETSNKSRYILHLDDPQELSALTAPVRYRTLEEAYIHWGWESPEVEMARQHENLFSRKKLSLASEKLDFFATEEGLKAAETLQYAYMNNVAISMPGARRALEDAEDVVRKMEYTSTPPLSEEELEQLKALKLWITQARVCGCLHNTTEQICYCVALVQGWFARHYMGEGFYGHKEIEREIPSGVSLKDILHMPWSDFQHNYPNFLKEYQRLGFNAKYAYPIVAEIVELAKWPRVCTFQPLTIEDFRAFFGKKFAIQGFLKEPAALHDGHIYTCNSLPLHDRSHIKDTLEEFLRCTEEFRSHKGTLKDFLLKHPAPFKDDGFCQKANKLLRHVAHSIMLLEQHLTYFSPREVTLFSLLLFEHFHENNISRSLYEWVDSLHSVEIGSLERKTEEVMSDIYDEITKNITHNSHSRSRLCRVRVRVRVRIRVRIRMP